MEDKTITEKITTQTIAPSKKMNTHDPRKEAKEKELKEKEEDCRLIRGKFLNHEMPGAPLSFGILKYKGKLEKYTLKHDQVYELPLYVVRHLNTNAKYNIYSYEADSVGDPMEEPTLTISQVVRRFNFLNTEMYETGESAL